ncbi:hypothetical protein [Luteolibacter soli]|uniref:Uncharacterized protein n=1 Tax=Luteolibacter soli TaxID=3135280 RepID=A0ABU9AX80_9BACT
MMTTAVLDVRELAQLMVRYSGRASRGAAAGCRDEEEDAVLLGKLLLLDDLAWRVWSEEMSATEMAELRAAANELGRAVEVLTGRIAAASKGGAGVVDDGEAIDLTEVEGGIAR